MTDLLERPRQQRRERARPQRQAVGRRRADDIAGSVRVAALVVAAVLPFSRVFATGGWFMPLLLAGLLPIAVSYAALRLRAAWWATAGILILAWLWYAAATLLPSTLWGGILPTVTSVRIVLQAATLAVQRVAVLPAPVYPEIPLLLLAITGVWWVAVSIDVLALRLASPGKAVICAATLWLVPLAIVPTGNPPWVLAAPLVLASTFVMLASADRDVVRWGPVVLPGRQPRERPTAPRRPTGITLAVGALLIGVVLAGLLPGFGDPPWYQLRARSTTTLTDNPIVQLRTNLVATNTGPIMRVRSPQPVYLRTTALDQYSDTEVWETSGIQPEPLEDGFVPGGNFTERRKEVRVQVLDVTDGVLVPAPTGPLRFRAPRGIRPRYDERTSTFTFGADRLASGQRYSVVASTPEINADVAETIDTPAVPQLTQLPDQVPPEVAELAQTIVDDANATTSFTRALAIQNELRTWDYSLTPPPGHGGVAMRSFLQNRVGYCEQFAATMAVMLRTLDIPARVAVGFTPGTVDPDDPTLWTVTWANAHAWVEVKFGGEWIAFEPTPRSDGNVLVPSVSDMTPSQTAERPEATSPDAGSAGDEFNIFDEREALQNRADQPVPEPGSAIGGAATGVSQRLTDPTLVTGAVTALITALALLVYLGRRAAVATTASGRVLAVRERVGRLGRGLGVPAPAWETDHEYLTRLSGRSPHGGALATAVTTARFSRSVPEAVADEAERAGAALSDELLAERPGWQRPLIRLRGDIAAGWARVSGHPRRVSTGRQRSSSSRRRRSWK